MNGQQFLTVTALLVLLLTSPSRSATCIDPDLASCTTAYTNSLKGSVITNKDLYCGVLQRYRNCVQDICAVVPDDIIDFIVNAQTHYFDCGISSSQERSFPSTLLIMMTSGLSMLVVYHWR